MATKNSQSGSVNGNVATSFYKNFRRSVAASTHEARHHETGNHWHLLSCLAFAISHDVDLIPIKWQPDFEDSPDYVLEGGTSRINKLRATVQMSFIFKRVRVLDQFKQLDIQGTYRVLLKELATLTHTPIREHMNIVRLEGLCWDFDNEKMYPALVFERAACGDAFAFFNSMESHGLSFEDKTRLCADIGKALLTLHASRKVTAEIACRFVSNKMQESYMET
jgi:hypothetical protein